MIMVRAEAALGTTRTTRTERARGNRRESGNRREGEERLIRRCRVGQPFHERQTTVVTETVDRVLTAIPATSR